MIRFKLPSFTSGLNFRMILATQSQRKSMYVKGNREIVKIITDYKKSMEEHVATITALEEEKVKLNKVIILRYLLTDTDYS